jgi:hypothetical protein
MMKPTVISLLVSLVLSGVAAGANGLASLARAADAPIRAVKTPDAAKPNAYYVGNRQPLLPSPLRKLPIGVIRPEGWLRTQLELEADGFSGRLLEISGFLKKEGNAWLSVKGEGHSPWEELPYWLKGYGDLGYVLHDEAIVKQARQWLEAAIVGQREDGYFGPRANLNGEIKGKPDLWPNMLMLNALQSYYEFSGDQRVPDLMTRYFRWELALPEEKFLPGSWQQQRAADNLASVYWLYNRSGQPWLLDLARKIHRHTADWNRGIASFHGVNFCQCFRGPAVFYQQTADRKDLEATLRNYATIMSDYGQVPGGMFGADENCRPGYGSPRQAAETCSMAELMLSAEQLAAITGQTIWADRCEEVAFNSLPASMTPDLKALHYLTAPNLVLCDRKNKSPGLQNGGAMLLFDPYGHRCCQHNVAHAWPYYAEHLWMAAPADGLAAVLYGPSRVTAKVGDGTEVTIAETTQYPFDETIELALATPKAVQFPLLLRVPGWCRLPEVSINGKPAEARAESGSFLVVDRTWSDGDKLSLRLPMQVELTTWKANQDSVSVRRGPLWYSLAIGERYVRAGGTEKWPAWEIYPTTAWNYGLVLDAKDPAASLVAVKRAWPARGQPFEAESAPVELKAKGRKIPGWTMDRLGLVGLLQPSPVRSSEPAETIRLIPMGCARLRISAFPTIGDGLDAHDWPLPSPPAMKATSSHCFQGDTEDALSDGLLPKSSHDQSISRFTWWDHRGTTEWVAYQFPKTRKISAVEVYWFDDTGRGSCRVPRAWHVEWLDGRTWRPVGGAGEYGVDRDRFNGTRFEPIEAAELRLVVDLQPGFSGGILGWRVK